jgi:hypothetical protein
MPSGSGGTGDDGVEAKSSWDCASQKTVLLDLVEPEFIMLTPDIGQTAS